MSGENFAKIIEQIFRRNGAWSRLKGELSVYFWPRIAGPEIAKKVEAIRYQNGLLYLQTENPALAHQVSLLAADIIQRFQKILGKGIIRGIKVKIGPVSGLQAKPRSSSSQEYPLTELEQANIKDCCNMVKDPDLAKGLGKLMHNFYQSQKQLLAEGGNRCSSCHTVIAKEYLYCPCCQRKI